MKKLMFLTMIFGLMMVFTGSISAQERPGRLENNCAGKSFKVGMKAVFGILGSGKAKALIAQRDKKGENYGPWYAVCDLIIDGVPLFKEGVGTSYYSTLDVVSGNFVLKNGYRVKWQPTRTGDLYTFTTADGKEVGFLNANLDKTRPW